MMFLVAFAHFMACFWYGVSQQSAPGASWVTRTPEMGQEISDRYAHAFHWSVAQFAGGMDEITPENTAERLFAIVAFLFSFVVAAWFISSLTSSMTKLNIIGSDN